MGMGSVPSSKLALERAGLEVSDMHLIAANEAFAAQSPTGGAAALSREDTHGGQSRSWQERRVVEVMKQIGGLVTPTTSVAAAAQLLVERGINGMPVVAYASRETEEQSPERAGSLPLLGFIGCRQMHAHIPLYAARICS
jgi:hypothetical protein